MGEYEVFANKYFPFSSKIKNGEIIYQLVCESNLISKVMLKYIDLNMVYLNKEKIIFYKRFRDGINKLLIYLPLNEEIGINACMRFAIEQFLKFIYAIYFDKEINEISRTGYRHIKEDIHKNIFISEKVKSELQKLYTYYAKYSNDMHAKEIDQNEELISLGRIIKSDNEYANGIETDLRNVLNISYRIMHFIFHVKYEILNASERMSIEKLRSQKRRENIYRILEYNI